MGNRLFVGNLPWEITETELRDFLGAGAVTSVRIMVDRETGRSRGFAFVDMIDEAAAQEAIRTRDGCQLGGWGIRVNEANEKERRPSSGGYGGGGQRDDRGRGGGRGKSRRRRDQRDDEYDSW